MSKYDVFLVDADDTIFDFHAAAAEALKKSFLERSLPYSDEVYSTYMEINDVLWKRLERKEITQDELKALRFTSVFKRLGIDFSGDEMSEVYVKNLGECAVIFKGAEEFLSELCSLGDVYIITNGFKAVQERRLKKFGIERYAKGVFVSEEVGANKPDIRYLNYVEERIPSFDRKTALVIGDSLTSDIALANAGNIDCVWYNAARKPLTGNAKVTFTASTYAEALSFIKNS